MSGRWQLAVAEAPVGEGRGEDRWLFHEAPNGTAWAAVIDGASSEARETPTGGEYADGLRSAILTVLRATPDRDLIAIVRSAIADAARRLELPKPSAPSAALGLARWTDTGVAVAVLGDVSVAILSDTAETVIRDDRISKVGTPERARYKDALHAGAGYGSAHRDTMGRLREAERRARNTEGGYWIAADDPAAANHALTYVTSGPVSKLVLASDGAAAALSRYNIVRDWRAFSELALRSPGNIERAIRACEQSDSRGQHWPRSKKHDDLTALVIARATDV